MIWGFMLLLFHFGGHLLEATFQMTQRLSSLLSVQDWHEARFSLPSRLNGINVDAQ